MSEFISLSVFKLYFQFHQFEMMLSMIIRLVTVGNLTAAVNLLLSTPPESSFFYPNALRAVALSSAVSRSLNELAVKVAEGFFSLI